MILINLFCCIYSVVSILTGTEGSLVWVSAIVNAIAVVLGMNRLEKKDKDGNQV